MITEMADYVVVQFIADFMGMTFEAVWAEYEAKGLEWLYRTAKEIEDET